MSTIQPPRLDDRSWQDLRDELIRRIPMHAPEWTDRSAADPGVTLIELFAFLGDNLLYRLNRAPEAAKLAFLKLLNMPLRPAVPAMAQVRLMLQKGAFEPFTPPFSPTEPRLEMAAGDIVFEAEEEITVLPLELSGWTKLPYQPSTGESEAQAIGREGVDQLLHDHLGSEAKPVLSAYVTTPMPMAQGGAMPVATSTAATLDGRLWLALLAPEDTLKTLDPRAPDKAMEALRRAISGQVLSLGVRTDDALCGPCDVLRCPDPGSAAGAAWPLRFEISTGRFIGEKPRLDGAAFLRLPVESDGTEGLTRSGTIKLRLPALRGDGTPSIGDWTAESFEPPEPDLLGIGPMPPRLDDPKLAARVLAWVSLRRLKPEHPPVRVRLMEVNTVSAIQAQTAPPELLGYGTGRPAQSVRLSKAPVLAGSEQVQVRGALGWERWRAVDDLLLAAPDDPVYALDPQNGTVTFGDGLHGRMPLPGEAIRCLGYRAGGGARGNVAAAAIARVRNQPLRCENTLPAAGGQDAETIQEAEARIPRTLRAHDRAVAAEDFVEIALETPGRKVGRAHVLPRHKPQQRVDGVPGTVALVVLPAQDPVTPETPMPDRDMLRRVCAQLEPRRLVTTELYVIPPEYVPVDLSVAVEPEAGTGSETLKRWVELALRQHFAPLPPYGPDGAGWPFGRAVRDRDAEAAALRVQGVRLLNEVLVAGEAIAPNGTRMWAEGTVPMLSWQLPYVRNVSVALGEAADPIAPEAPGPQPPITGMPVPVELEKC